jgi:hypothetical protein
MNRHLFDHQALSYASFLCHVIARMFVSLYAYALPLPVSNQTRFLLQTSWPFYLAMN